MYYTRRHTYQAHISAEVGTFLHQQASVFCFCEKSVVDSCSSDMTEAFLRCLRSVSKAAWPHYCTGWWPSVVTVYRLLLTISYFLCRDAGAVIGFNWHALKCSVSEFIALQIKTVLDRSHLPTKVSISWFQFFLSCLVLLTPSFHWTPRKRWILREKVKRQNVQHLQGC